MSRATSPTEGKIGQGLKFDGVDDYVSLPRAGVTSGTGFISASAWVRPAILCDDSSSFCTILGNINGQQGSDHQIFSFKSTGSTDNISFLGTTVTFTAGTIGAANKWHHFVGTFDGTNVRVYLDGILQGSPTAGTLTTATENDVFIGSEIGGGSPAQRYFNGSLDDVRIYNRALSAGEVASLYTMGTATVNASTNALNTSGLVGQWSFDGKQTVWTSSTAATTLDTSGNNNTGTLTNMSQSTSVTPGKIGQALKFDSAQSQIVNVPYNSVLDLPDAGGAVSYWINFTMPGQNRERGLRKLAHSNQAVACGYQLGVHQAGPTDTYATFWAVLGADASTQCDSYAGTTHLVPNTWYMLTMTWTSSTVTEYINGTQEFQSARTKSLVWPSGLGSLRLGQTVGTYQMYHNGSLDDVRIYNRALSAGEVASLYTMGTTTVNASTNALNTSGLVGQWSFDGKQTVWTSSTAATTLDTSGQSNTGTLTNMSQSTSPTEGKIGQALTFNGSDDYVTVPNASSLNPTNVTVAAWVKTDTTGGYIIAKDPPNDSLVEQTSSPVITSAEKQPVNLLEQPSTIKRIAASITVYKNKSILLTLFLLSLFGLGFYKSKQKKISANSVISAIVIFVLLIPPFLFPFTAYAVCANTNRYWVGGTGTWDASDTTHWSTASGGAGGASVPSGSYTVIFDASSGGGTVTLGVSPSITSLTMGAFTGTFDASTFSPTLSGCSNIAFSGTGTGIRTLNMGSGTWTVKAGTAHSAPWNITDATNLTLNAQTSTVKITSVGGTLNLTFGGGSQIYNNVWFARTTATGNNVVSGSNTFNDFKDDGSAAHNLIFTNGTTQTVSTFTVSGTAPSVITINSDTTATHALVKTGGGTISSDYLNIQHSVATPSSTWYAGTNSVNNQGVSTAGSGWTFTAPPAGGPANMPYGLSTVGGGQFIIISGSTTYTVTSSTSITDNQWHHVVGTYDGTTMRIYVDGTQTGTNTDFSGDLPTTKTGAVHIGADYNTTPANFFTGSLDDVRLYNRALSSGEVASLYNSGR